MKTMNIQQDILKALKEEMDSYINWLPNEIINIIINNLYEQSISNNSSFEQVVDFLKRNINRKVYIYTFCDEGNGNCASHEGIITINKINDFTNNKLVCLGNIHRESQIKFVDSNGGIYNIYNDSYHPINKNNTRLTLSRWGIRMNSYFIKECINDE